MRKQTRGVLSPLESRTAGFARAALVTAITAAAMLPTALEAQRSGRQGGMRPQMGGSVAFLLEKAEDLDLSAEQKTSLDALANETREANAPVREKIESMRGTGNRDGMREVMTTMRANDEASVEKAMALLDDSQKEAAKALLKERRPQRRRPPG
jgi:hypothetical protein